MTRLETGKERKKNKASRRQGGAGFREGGGPPQGEPQAPRGRVLVPGCCVRHRGLAATGLADRPPKHQPDQEPRKTSPTRAKGRKRVSDTYVACREAWPSHCQPRGSQKNLPAGNVSELGRQDAQRASGSLSLPAFPALGPRAAGAEAPPRPALGRRPTGSPTRGVREACAHVCADTLRHCVCACVHTCARVCLQTTARCAQSAKTRPWARGAPSGG